VPASAEETVRFTRAQRVAIGAAVAALVALLTAIIVADRLAAWGTRRVLARLDGYRASFASVDVRIGDLAYVVHGLRLDAERDDATLVRAEVDRAEIALDGSGLLRGDLVARVTLDAPRARVVQRRADPTPRSVGGVGLPRSLPSGFVDRLEVRRGEIVWTDASSERRPTLRFHAVEAELDNLPTGGHEARDAPTALELRGRLQDSGELRASLSGDPAARRPTFSGTAVLGGL
jgi:hypothetical protein